MRDDQFRLKLLQWFDQFGRKDLPWQRRRTPYRVWVSEVMLQQTQVATVIPYYVRFMKQFPSLSNLAGAHLDQVLQLWSGLGYYARARNMHKAARIIVDQHKGRFPRQLQQLTDLPGIGRSTAGAILSLACNQHHSILDGNVKRVLSRYFLVPGWSGTSATSKTLWAHSDRLTPSHRVADFNQAMMDLGATVCLRSQPVCHACPLGRGCQAMKQGCQEDYPQRKPTAAKPLKQKRLLIVLQQDQVLLQKRPPAGIWGGLLSFPELDLHQDSKHWCQAHGLKLLEQEDWDVRRHSFTHFHLDMHPSVIRVKTVKTMLDSRVMEQEQWFWYKHQEACTGAVAAPVKQLLKELVLKELVL